MVLCEGTETLTPMIITAVILWVIVGILFVKIEIRRKK
tara:strand:- start:34 stop:147 length:114 start_codon:yes stop_codon:yes gene_type:complete